LRKFVSQDKIIYALDPDFENIELAYAEPIAKAEETEGREYSEEFLLETVDKQIKETWYRIRDELIKYNPSIIFNPTKYYISIKLGKSRSYFTFRKRKIRLVAMLPEDEAKKILRKHQVIHLSPGVQNFWNGSCCEVIIENHSDIDEIIEMIQAIFNPNIQEA